VFTFVYHRTATPEGFEKKVRLLENGSGHYSVQSVLIIIIIIIIINDSIYPAVNKASRTGNKVSCQPNVGAIAECWGKCWECWGDCFSFKFLHLFNST